MLRLHSFGPEDGRPVLALHPLKGHGRRWRQLATEQLPHLRVHAPDLRGHGDSPKDPPWTLERHVDDVLAIMNAAGLYRVAVIGASLGATVAVYLARRVPHRVSRLVLLEPGTGRSGKPVGRRAEETLAAPGFAEPRQAALARARSWPAAASQLVESEVAEHLERGPDGRWRWRYLPAMAAATYPELTRPALTPPPGTPTLLVLAARCGAVGPEYLAACHAALGADLNLVELDSGRRVDLERPAWTGALIRDFLA